MREDLFTIHQNEEINVFIINAKDLFQMRQIYRCQVKPSIPVDPESYACYLTFASVGHLTNVCFCKRFVQNLV